MRQWEEPHPDKPGEMLKKYENLDRYYITFSTMHAGKVVHLEIDDRANMFEEDHAELGDNHNMWNKKRQKILIHELESWVKSMHYGTAIPVMNQKMN